MHPEDLTPLDGARSRLAAAYLPAAFKVAAGFIRSRPQLREDLDAEARFAAVKAAQRWRGDPAGGPAFAYHVKATTRRVLLDYLRSRASKKRRAEPMPPGLPCPRPDRAAALDAADQVEDLMRRIRPRERLAVEMIHLDGLTYREAAAASGIDSAILHRLATSGLHALRQWARVGPLHPGEIRRG